MEWGIPPGEEDHTGENFQENFYAPLPPTNVNPAPQEIPTFGAELDILLRYKRKVEKEKSIPRSPSAEIRKKPTNEEKPRRNSADIQLNDWKNYFELSPLQPRAKERQQRSISYRGPKTTGSAWN